MSNFQRTAAWLAACGKEQSPENLSVQIGCHIEEFIEFLDALQFKGAGIDDIAANLIQEATTDAAQTLLDLAECIKRGDLAVRVHPDKRADALDALCDSEVTGNGVAFLAGFNKDAADREVLASNDAKLVDGKPVLKAGGKIGKPEGWVAPDLAAFV